MKFIVTVITLVCSLLIVGGLSLTVLGDLLFGLCGRNPLVFNRQLLTAGILLALGALLSLFSRLTRGELIATTVAVQLVVMTLFGWYFDAETTWEVTLCTTLPFALSIALCLGIQTILKHGQPISGAAAATRAGAGEQGDG